MVRSSGPISQSLPMRGRSFSQVDSPMRRGLSSRLLCLCKSPPPLLEGDRVPCVKRLLRALLKPSPMAYSWSLQGEAWHRSA